MEQVTVPVVHSRQNLGQKDVDTRASDRTTSITHLGLTRGLLPQDHNAFRVRMSFLYSVAAGQHPPYASLV